MSKKLEPKKQETKQQEPPAEQPQDPDAGGPYRPMAAKEPDPIDKLEAVELRLTVLEKIVEKHQRYHFGGSGQS
jgi:hypothetical protein